METDSNYVCVSVTGDADMGRDNKRSVAGRAAGDSEVKRWRAHVV